LPPQSPAPLFFSNGGSPAQKLAWTRTTRQKDTAGVKNMAEEKNYRLTDSHQFNVGIAQMYGVDEAILLQHLHFWIDKNEANGTNFHEGKYWTFNSAKAFTKIFPYWNAKSISRKLDNLEARGLIVSGNFNKDLRDRTKWYTLSESVQSIFHYCPTDFPQVSQSIPTSVPPLPDSKPDINTDNKKSKEKSLKFSAPTVDEVRAYCTERKNSVNPEQWYDHYQSNGWMVGKTHMKDWKAAVRTWEHKSKDFNASESHTEDKKGWGGYLC
jgi:hypothetical protein